MINMLLQDKMMSVYYINILAAINKTAGINQVNFWQTVQAEELFTMRNGLSEPKHDS